MCLKFEIAINNELDDISLTIDRTVQFTIKSKAKILGNLATIEYITYATDLDTELRRVWELEGRINNMEEPTC